MDKDVSYKTMEYYSAIKKNGIMPSAAAWMDVEILILSEIRQKERQMPYDINYVESKMTRTHLQNKQTNTEMRHGCQSGREVGKGLIESLGLAGASHYM